jgi:nucleotide-binding universal stress UspA family protein
MTGTESSGPILLALSTTRQSPKTIERAISEAEKGSKRMVSLFVVDHGVPDSIGRLLITTGYLGEKPSQKLADAILDEYRERGLRRLGEICADSSKRGIRCETMLREGDFAEEVLKVTAEKDAGKVVLTRAKRSGLSRFLFGSAVNRVREKASCPVEIVKE